MGRLQDYPDVTPSASDKFLVVQSTGQGLVAQTSKMNSANPTGTGTLTMTGNGVFSGGLSINGSQPVGLAPFGYNANTDRTIESNRQDAMRYLRTNFFTKGGSTAIVRYSGGYFHTYIFGGNIAGLETFIEFTYSLGADGKIIYWQYMGDTFTKVFSIT